MIARDAFTAGASNTERRLVLLAVATVIVLRSAVFVFWEQSNFDSDQAVIGLMAKHLSELRAFPVFMYGSHHLLGVEAWMAAPLFLVAGASVAALKLPLLAINVAFGLLLIRTFERDAGLRPAAGAAAALFFVLPAPGTAAHFLEASGGNLEPFFYVLLLWLTRKRPIWCGVVLGIGFLHREFTLYGFLALLVVEAAEGSLLTGPGIRRKLVTVGATLVVWLVVSFAKQYSSAAGPGTSVADLSAASNNLKELSDRICFDLRTLVEGFGKLFTVHWPRLFGTRAQPVLDFAIDSQVSQGLTGSWVLLAGAALMAVAGVVAAAVTSKDRRPRLGFCAYLTLVGLLSSVTFVVARCGQVAVMRYELLSVLGAVGLGGWYLSVERSRARRVIWVGLVAGFVAVAAVAHVRLWAEYLTHPPYGTKRMIIRHLEARGIRGGFADYWNAYYISFLTDERIILASDDFTRILTYDRIVEEHRAEAVRVARTPCAGGENVMPGVYFCLP